MGLASSQPRTFRDDCVTVSASCAAFSGAYFLIRHFAFPQMSANFNNRMTSLLHALIMLPMSAAVLDLRRPWADFGTRTTDAQAFCLCVTFGYFAYDTIGVYLIEHDWTNTVHHLASMGAFSIGIFQRLSGSELAWTLFFMEVSNPFLHLRSYLKETGKSARMTAEIVNGLFALSFLVCRLIIGPALTYTVLACPTSSPVVKVGGLGVQIISIYWAYLIGKIAVFKVHQAKAAGTDGAALEPNKEPTKEAID